MHIRIWVDIQMLGKMKVKGWVAFIVVVVLGCGYYLMSKPLAVRAALPLKAIVSMDEYYLDFAPLPDFIHCIKVDVSEKEFNTFASDMELSPYKGDDKFPTCNVRWWNASGDASQAFYYPGSRKESSVFAKLENGTLFYVAQAW